MNTVPEPSTTLTSVVWLKDVWGPAIGTALAATIGLIGVMLKLQYNRRKDDREEEARQAEQAEKDRKDAIEADTARTDSMTNRFSALMDGYEAHIRNLTEEVSSLRDEIKSLRKALSDQMIRCANCPTPPKGPMNAPAAAAPAGP